MANKVLTNDFSEPLNGAIAARINIHVGDGNLVIDRLAGREEVLARGTLEYLETQGLPERIFDSKNGRATLLWKARPGSQPSFRFPWSACNGATEWHVHLNPAVSSDITAQSNGGNIKLDLSGMLVTCVSAETGGGNLNMILPDNAANLSVAARTGGGNVTVEFGSGTRGSNIVNAKSGAGTVAVHIPSGIAARIHATTGWGKAIIDPRFIKTDENTYQSPDFDAAIDKIELTAGSGAGNVTVKTK